MKFYHIVLLFFSFKLNGQQTASQWYGMKEGLPQNSVKDIAKDKYGFIWLATDGGIVRFDGTNFLQYHNFKISNLSFNDFMINGKDEILCFNNIEQECVLIADRTAKIIPVLQAKKAYSSVRGVQSKKYYKNTPMINFFPGVNNYYIETNSGTYFFDNQKIEYRTANAEKKTIFKQYFPHSNLKNAFEQNGIIYIADPGSRRTMVLHNGLITYDEKPSLYNDPESRIYWHQGTRQVFVINGGNIYLSKIINGKPSLSFLMHSSDIENEFLFCIFFDEDSNKIYFGTAVKGINIINLSNFYIPQKNIPFAGEVVYEALPYSSSSVFTREGFEYSNKNVRRIFHSFIKYDKRFSLYDNSNNLLYLDFTINRRYRNSSFKKKDSISFPKRSIEGIYKAGHIYISSTSDYNSNFYLDFFYNDKFLDSKISLTFKDNINFVKAYNSNLIYVGTSNGIFIVSLSEKKVITHIAKGLPIKEIQSTKDGHFWFTTHNKGYYLLKNHKAIKMPDDREKYLLNAHHILEDEKGFFWISSNNGLFKVSKMMLLKFANDKSRVLYYRYSKEDGLKNNEFNGSANPSGNILANGEFVFPSMEGFVFFKPQEIRSHYPKRDQLFVERAQVGKEIIFFKEKLRLKSDYKRFDILLDIPYYYDIDNVYLEAKLDNSKDAEWKAIGSDKRYSVDNIDPGNYTLTIRFLVGENGSFAYKKVPIEIIPYFYQTQIFKTLMILLLAGAIILVIQIRTNFLKIKNKKLKTNLHNRNQELQKTSNKLEITKTKLKNESEYQQKIMESISHDIMTPVKFIALLSQKLNDTEDPGIQKKYLDGIYKSSEQLFKFTLNLKEYNDLYKEDSPIDEYVLHDIIEDKRLLFEPIASSNNSTITNISNPLLKVNTKKNILAAILHNILDNAVKNTFGGKIIIKTTLKSENVEIEISDTGSGMSESQISYYTQVSENIEDDHLIFKKYGLGLHMVIQLSKKINAGISFHENFPDGTIVRISLKNNMS